MSFLLIYIQNISKKAYIYIYIYIYIYLYYTSIYNFSYIILGIKIDTFF